MIHYTFPIAENTIQHIFTSGGIPKVFPVTVAHHTIKYENPAIHMILPIKVIGKNFRAEKQNETINGDSENQK